MEQDNFVKNIRYIVDYHKKHGKNSYLYFSEEKKQNFINRCDNEIIEDIVTGFDINPDDLTWEVFYPKYQEYHAAKYGEFLKT